MESNEIRSWFDQAFLRMSQGDFARASACFQVIIDRSGDLHSIQTARRDQAWCAPIQSIIEKLHTTPHPIALAELAAELGHAVRKAEPDLLRALAERLAQVQTVLPVNELEWVSRDQLQTALERAIISVANERKPRTFSQLASGLFSGYGDFRLSLTPAFQSFIRAILWREPDLVAIDHGCLFHRSALVEFANSFALSIQNLNAAQSLRRAIDLTTWNADVRSSVSVNSLGHWLETQTSLGLIQVGDDFWFTNQLLDLSTMDVTPGFIDPYSMLTTRELVKHYFLAGLGNPTDEFLAASSDQLARNSRLLSLEGNRWVLQSSFDALVQEMMFRLLCADHPVTLQELQSDALAAHPVTEPFFGLVMQSFRQRLEQDAQIISVSASTFLHSRSLPLLVDLLCEHLLPRPRSFHDLVREILVPLTHGEESPHDFLLRLQNEMASDDRFLIDDEGRWRAIPPGNRLNNIAYSILFEKHRPLTRQELDGAIKGKSGRPLPLDLSNDPRFRQWTDRRWMLAEWIMINDHAADYLAGSKLSATKQDIIKRSGVLPELAIFEPERDSRFQDDPSGRWTCRSAGIPLTSQMVDQLVLTARNSMSGLSLDQLVRSTFQRPRSDFNGVDEALLRDGRLRVCDGLWYPKEAVREISPDEMEQVLGYLANRPRPIPSEELSLTVFKLPPALTDLESKLHSEPYVGNAGPSGWYFRNENSPAYGQVRAVLFPLHSVKFVPSFRAEHLVVADAAAPARVNPLASQVGMPVPRPRRVTVTLGYEDIRDGTLAVSSTLRRFFDIALALASFTISDPAGNPLTCWYDSDRELILGLAPWFRSREFFYGDKIRLGQTADHERFTLELLGERDEAVHREAIRRRQLEDLLHQAALGEMHAHDLVVEVLKFFDVPLHIDDLWRLVDYTLGTRKDALIDLLGEHSYFRSEGLGYWGYDNKEYDRMIRELEQQVRFLSEQNRDLQQTADRITDLSAEIARLNLANDGLRGDLDRATAVIKELTDEKARVHTNANSLASALASREAQLSELQGRLSVASTEKDQILEQYGETISHLKAQLELAAMEKATLQQESEKQREDLESLEALLRTREQEIEAQNVQISKHQASINELGRQLGGAANKLTHLQAELEEEQNRSETLQKEIDNREDNYTAALRAREEAYAAKSHAIKEMQDKVNEATVAIKNAERAEAARMAVYEDLETGRRDVDKLKGQIEDLKAGRDALMAQYARAEADRQQLEKMLAEARRQRDTMIEQYDRLNVDYRALRAADLINKQMLTSPIGRLARWITNVKSEDSRSSRRRRPRDEE